MTFCGTTNVVGFVGTCRLKRRSECVLNARELEIGSDEYSRFYCFVFHFFASRLRFICDSKTLLRCLSLGIFLIITIVFETFDKIFYKLSLGTLFLTSAFPRLRSHGLLFFLSQEPYNFSG